MDLKEKVIKTLEHQLSPTIVKLSDDKGSGLTGYIVSVSFQRKTALARQEMIDRALRQPSSNLSREERRQVLMIAGLTPAEYASLEIEPSNNPSLPTEKATGDRLGTSRSPRSRTK